MRTKPLISIIIPTWNREQFVRAALESALSQTLPDFEVILACDTCNSQTRAPAQRATWARDWREARISPFSIRMTVWLPGKLRAQIEFLHGHPDIDMVFGFYVEFCATHDRPDRDELPDVMQAESLPMPGCSSGTLLIRAEAFARAGSSNNSLRSCCQACPIVTACSCTVRHPLVVSIPPLRWRAGMSIEPNADNNQLYWVQLERVGVLTND